MDPSYGTATLCRFLTGLKILETRNGKPLSYNTIKQDITEIRKELLREKTGKKPKENNKKKTVRQRNDSSRTVFKFGFF